MTLMTLNLGYGIGISQIQRHKRHQRHYRHARTVPGVWGTPQKCVCGYPNAMLAKHVPAQSGGNQIGYPYKFIYAPKWISLDSSQNLDSKKRISFDDLRYPAERSRCKWPELYYLDIMRRQQSIKSMVYWRVCSKGEPSNTCKYCKIASVISLSSNS